MHFVDCQAQRVGMNHIKLMNTKPSAIIICTDNLNPTAVNAG